MKSLYMMHDFLLYRRQPDVFQFLGDAPNDPHACSLSQRLTCGPIDSESLTSRVTFTTL